ncbi:SDR family oxidoreductase [Patescibacteria group bacterium AH-259-L07]|nr:SDR family oxidoreductase [Patescibacteria group bacterium AH-259-L07]
MELKNKVVVITGASKGLGKSLANAFTKQGSKLILSARSKKQLKIVANKIKALPFVADVTNEKHVTNLARFAVKKHKRIDIWINNAGIWIPHAPIEELDSKKVHNMIEVNLLGTMYGSKAALIQMKKQGSGTIINILSTSALEGRAGGAPYCASKYGADGFTKSLRLEAEPENIQVFAIYPGGMKTNLFDAKKPSNFDEFMDPDMVAQTILENLQKQNPEKELILKRS